MTPPTRHQATETPTLAGMIMISITSPHLIFISPMTKIFQTGQDTTIEVLVLLTQFPPKLTRLVWLTLCMTMTIMVIMMTLRMTQFRITFWWNCLNTSEETLSVEMMNVTGTTVIIIMMMATETSKTWHGGRDGPETEQKCCVQQYAETVHVVGEKI